jgi:hypothetical protein
MRGLRTRPDATYRVVRENDDSFVVEVVRLGTLPQMVGGIASEAEAGNWIVQDKRLWDAADPLRRPAGRKWRGFLTGPSAVRLIAAPTERF